MQRTGGGGEGLGIVSFDSFVKNYAPTYQILSLEEIHAPFHPVG